MKQIKAGLWLSAGLIGLSSFLISQEDLPKKILLFKIEKEKRQTCYVFGTSHLIPADQFNISPAVNKKLLLADTVLMEIDMDDPMMAFELMAGVTMKNGGTISSMISEEDADRLNKLLKASSGLGLEIYDQWMPYFLTTVIGFHDDSLVQYKSYDLTFVSKAMEKGIPILGLEMISDQTNALHQIPYEQQAQELLKTLNGRDFQNTDSLFVLYEQGDPEALHDFISHSTSSQEIEVLVYNRNRNWIPRIDSLAMHSDLFIAFGAGHLGGELGVLNLLKECGWTVSRVN
tara:strand:+ start:150 stop:1013 length:864 start_codon:yes stop_codon:yes gene_type:complete